LNPLDAAGLAGWLQRADRPHPGTDGFADDRPTDRRRGDAIAELFTANAAPPDNDDDAGQDGEGGQGEQGEQCEQGEGADDPARLWTHDAQPAGRDGAEGDAHDVAGASGEAGRDGGPDGPVVCPPSNVAITVSIALAELHARLGQVGLLHTGGTLTPAQLRRLACDAALIPAVLGGPGQVLDLGRATRDWTLPQRRAVTLRDQGCAAPGCDRPPGRLPDPSPRPLGGRRPDRPVQRLPALHLPSPAGAPAGLAGSARPKRLPGVHPTRLDRPRPKT
ncbi:MAG: DUF222 domain-containing protein, partial [Actinomycetes bacterium]